MIDLQAEGTKAMNLIFDTFKRSEVMTFYKSAKKEIVGSDSQYNADFDNPYVSSIVREGQKREFECRVIWLNEEEIQNAFPGIDNSSVKVKMPKGVVRIQLKTEAYDFFKDVNAVFLGEDKFIVYSDMRKVGIFGDYDFFEILAIRET